MEARITAKTLTRARKQDGGGAQPEVGTAGTSRSAVRAADCPTRPRGLSQGRELQGEARTARPCLAAQHRAAEHRTEHRTEPRAPHRAPAMSKVSPTETERCIESLLAVFQRYAGHEGDNRKLSKKEFLAFMNTELAAFTKNQKDPAVLDRMMKKLDLNSDGQLDFQEFLNLIGGIAVACHDALLAPHH